MVEPVFFMKMKGTEENVVQRHPQHSHKKSTRKPDYDPKQEKRKNATKQRKRAVQRVAEADADVSFHGELIGVSSHVRTPGSSKSWAPPNVQIALPRQRTHGFFRDGL